MADEAERRRRRTPAPAAPNDTSPQDQEQLFGDLSGIAREAVRSPADPRLDTHLAFLGLGDGPASATAGSPPPIDPAPVAVVPAAAPAWEAQRAALQAELDQLRATVLRLQTTAAESADRLRQLTFVIGVLAIATVVALIIGIVR